MERELNSSGHNHLEATAAYVGAEGSANVNFPVFVHSTRSVALPDPEDGIREELALALGDAKQPHPVDSYQGHGLSERVRASGRRSAASEHSSLEALRMPVSRTTRRVRWLLATALGGVVAVGGVVGGVVLSSRSGDPGALPEPAPPMTASTGDGAPKPDAVEKLEQKWPPEKLSVPGRNELDLTVDRAKLRAKSGHFLYEKFLPGPERRVTQILIVLGKEPERYFIFYPCPPEAFVGALGRGGVYYRHGAGDAGRFGGFNPAPKEGQLTEEEFAMIYRDAFADPRILGLLSEVDLGEGPLVPEVSPTVLERSLAEWQTTPQKIGNLMRIGLGDFKNKSEIVVRLLAEGRLKK